LFTQNSGLPRNTRKGHNGTNAKRKQSAKKTSIKKVDTQSRWKRLNRLPTSHTTSGKKRMESTAPNIYAKVEWLGENGLEKNYHTNEGRGKMLD